MDFSKSDLPDMLPPGWEIVHTIPLASPLDAVSGADDPLARSGPPSSSLGAAAGTEVSEDELESIPHALSEELLVVDSGEGGAEATAPAREDDERTTRTEEKPKGPTESGEGLRPCSGPGSKGKATEALSDLAECLNTSPSGACTAVVSNGTAPTTAALAAIVSARLARPEPPAADARKAALPEPQSQPRANGTVAAGKSAQQNGGSSSSGGSTMNGKTKATSKQRAAATPIAVKPQATASAAVTGEKQRQVQSAAIIGKWAASGVRELADKRLSKFAQRFVQPRPRATDEVPSISPMKDEFLEGFATACRRVGKTDDDGAASAFNGDDSSGNDGGSDRNAGSVEGTIGIPGGSVAEDGAESMRGRTGAGTTTGRKRRRPEASAAAGRKKAAAVGPAALGTAVVAAADAWDNEANSLPARPSLQLRTTANERSGKGPGNRKERTVEVYNLPYPMCNVSDLTAYFQSYGAVEAVVVGEQQLGPRTLPDGRAKIVYESSDSAAAAALCCGGQILGNRDIRVFNRTARTPRGAGGAASNRYFVPPAATRGEGGAGGCGKRRKIERRCTGCGGPDHTENDCARKPGENCRVCGQSVCEQAHMPAVQRLFCVACGRLDHDEGRCRERLPPVSPRVICMACGGEGAGPLCCGSVRQPGRGVFCSNCGLAGHLASQCVSFRFAASLRVTLEMKGGRGAGGNGRAAMGTASAAVAAMSQLPPVWGGTWEGGGFVGGSGSGGGRRATTDGSGRQDGNDLRRASSGGTDSNGQGKQPLTPSANSSTGQQRGGGSGDTHSNYRRAVSDGDNGGGEWSAARSAAPATAEPTQYGSGGHILVGKEHAQILSFPQWQPAQGQPWQQPVPMPLVLPSPPPPQFEQQQPPLYHPVPAGMSWQAPQFGGSSLQLLSDGNWAPAMVHGFVPQQVLYMGTPPLMTPPPPPPPPPMHGQPVPWKLRHTP